MTVTCLKEEQNICIPVQSHSAFHPEFPSLAGFSSVRVNCHAEKKVHDLIWDLLTACGNLINQKDETSQTFVELHGHICFNQDYT